MVQQYHSLVPLEDLQAAGEQPSPALGVCTALLRAASPQLQGQAVTLRRMDPRQASTCLDLDASILFLLCITSVPSCSVRLGLLGMSCALPMQSLCRNSDWAVAWKCMLHGIPLAAKQQQFAGLYAVIGQQPQ